MAVKKGDKVKVITGSYKGTESVVVKNLPKTNKVIVKDVNVVKKHVKPTQENPNGGVVNKEMPIHVSNVKVIK